jgi:YidC/Oxa1 family membrane protein insertase
MSFGHAVSQLLIGPLKLIYEFIFFYARMFAKSAGLSIIVLSLAVNFLLLPMYRQADAIQNKEREQQKRMQNWVKHIKKNFSGNERFMMLQTYYRQNNYKPYYTLRGMLPLVLEIPFFIAAYQFLSGLSILEGLSFGPIRDLSLPDALLTIGSLKINVLPILMTAINIVSGYIYTKGLPWKDKLQLYAMAVIFLVLLYDSPSGLVVYWTMNNLFSLVKNLIGTFREPKKARNITLSVLGLLTFVWLIVIPKGGWLDYVPLIVIGIALQLPLVLSLLPKRSSKKQTETVQKEYKPSLRLFFCGCAFLSILTGVLIPSAVIASSPIEFVDLTDFRSPMVHIANALLLAIGLFVIWFGLFYYLSSKKGRTKFGRIVWILSGIAIVNYMFFGTNLGTLSAQLTFDQPMTVHVLETVINVVAIAAIAVLFGFLWKKSRAVVQIGYIVLGVAVIGMSVMNVSRISAAGPEIRTALVNNRTDPSEADKGVGKIIRLSKNKKNVIVLMLDRAMGSYIPYLFAERPELQTQFDGFTYYPNTLSFGGSTNFGASALYGGYEYAPWAMNARTDKTLGEKHNEALKVMPALFDGNGYAVTVIEPTYAGYTWIPDLSIYADYPDVKTYNIEHGQMRTALMDQQKTTLNEIWERNFFCFSIMKISPVLLQYPIYMEGTYCVQKDNVQYTIGLSESYGISTAFLNSYAVLEGLNGITVGEDSDEGVFIMMSNSMTHEPQLLQEPEYVPAQHVDNKAFDEAHTDRFTVNGRTLRVETTEQMQHYQINMSALIMLGNWFDYLRANGLYDNTRIIIVADHGHFLHQYDDLLLGSGRREDIMGYNPLLLVKDFDSTGFTVDDRFMTNADVPTLALSGLVEDPVNPFTGKPIDSDAKAEDQYVTISSDWDIAVNNGTAFSPAQWYSVHGNIFDRNNWKSEGTH